MKKDEKEFDRTLEYLDRLDNDIKRFQNDQNTKFRMLNHMSEERMTSDSYPVHKEFGRNWLLTQNSVSSKLDNRHNSLFASEAQKMSFQAPNIEQLVVQFPNPMKKKKLLMNRTSMDDLKGWYFKSGHLGNMLDLHISDTKRSQRNLDSPSTDVIKFYRSDSKDSKQEVGGLNNTVNVSNFLKYNYQSKFVENGIHNLENLQEQFSELEDTVYQGISEGFNFLYLIRL